MSTTAPAKQEGGYFPRWKEKTGGVIMRSSGTPAVGQTIVSGLQHSVAMAGATIIAFGAIILYQVLAWDRSKE
jgi:xanthine/uracil permease